MMTPRIARGAGVIGLVTVISALGMTGQLYAQDVHITPNVVYGNKVGLALTMDVYRPAHPNGAAVMWIISGGGRSRWERSSYRTNSDGTVRLATDQELVVTPSFRLLLNAGFTVFAAHHGSAPVFPAEEHVKDLRQAVQFIRLRAKDYGVDPKRIGLWGASGGGWLALLLGTTGDDARPNAEQAVDRVSSRVAAVVAYFAPTDLRRHIAARPPDQLPLYRELLPNSEAHDLLSPLRHVSSDDAPTLFVHGDADPQVKPIEGQSMSEALKAQGVDSQFILIPRAGHGFVGENAEQANKAALVWFQQHLAR